MTKKIRILHLEDVERDAEKIKEILKKGGMDVEVMIVDNRDAYVEALIEFAPDVILSGDIDASFNSVEALNIFMRTGMKIPFIIVTSTMSEEYAVSLMKAGASDYILKSNPEQIPTAIRNALEGINSEINLENNKAVNIKEKTNAVLVAQELERGEMGNELLENINQILAASNLYIDCAISEENQRMIFMQKSKKYLLLAIDEIKKLSQVIMPPTLNEIGLIDSLNNWIDFKQESTSINFVADWKNFDEHATDNKLQLTVYRIIQEQLNNIVKHSNARNAHISLKQTEDSLDLVIKDDGDGFNPSKHMNGTGFKNIHTRAEIHNGKILLHSEPGKGCMLTVVFPL
ncbi:MAG: putative signal transduction histidine kinase [Ferruginibacter sp.]|nr:putative signal transduction histidine kinase [Ferruginibacter sp.]